MLKTRLMIVLFALMLVISTGCGVKLDLGGGGDAKQSEAEQTLQAIYVQYTMDALVAAAVAPTTGVEAAPTVTPEPPTPTEIAHSTIPGNPGSPDQVKDEIDTSHTAGDRVALGDSFRLGNFERPFTQDVMDYKKENDLLEISLSEDNDFYIFSIKIVGPGEDGTLSAHYGIEFDSDFDVRGDVLLWAKGGDHPDWTIEDVMVLRDSNDDVGGSRPVLSDTDDGNGYDDVLFSKDVLNDPDAAWQRIDPGNADIIQLAIKKSMVGKSSFFWKAWADSGIADPARFDYNDSFSEEQAGSATKGSALYPVGQIFLVDSTCWAAYKFQASGKELGGCYQLQPTAVPQKPTCSPCPKYPNNLGSSCCKACGFYWSGSRCVFNPG